MSARFRFDPPRTLAQEMDEAARLYRACRLADAAERCRAALRLAPTCGEAWHLLGVTALLREDADAAVEPLQCAVGLSPGSPQAQYHLGNALLALDRRADAATRFRAALALRPDFVEAENNLGNALHGMGRDEEALVCYRRALAQQPDQAPALYNLGRALARLERHTEAEAALRAALAASDGHAPANRADIHAALANTLTDQAKDAAALEEYDAELRLRPDTPVTLANKALTLLRLGRFHEAWPLYEQRWRAPGFLTGREAMRPVPPILDLNRVAGQTILVRGEQGRGDVIQFARYVPLLHALGARVRLSIFPELVALLHGLPGLDAAYSDGDATTTEPPHDLVASLLSLPLAFSTELATIPATIPYLFADPSRRGIWAERLGVSPLCRVALCWSGSEHSRPRAAVGLATLLPLLTIHGAEFHAVTKEMSAPDRALLAATPTIRDHAPLLDDYAETAALLSLMDLVITVDTSVAHLAGALGRPAWILLRHSADWRWLRDRADSPWYPTARLFRDTDGRGWDTVMCAVVDALTSMLARSKRPLVFTA